MSDRGDGESRADVEARGAASQPAGLEGAPSAARRRSGRRKALVFGCTAALWLALDVLTKGFFNGPLGPGGAPGPSILGVFRFHLVHNTGAAWGMFGDATLVLGGLSLAVCAVLVVYLFAFSPRAGFLEAFGVALVVAGGVGNALDRFLLGYVVDFIEPVFVDFPVFNIADIGVTCGFVIFLLGMILSWRREDRMAAHREGAAPEGLEKP